MVHILWEAHEITSILRLIASNDFVGSLADTHEIGSDGGHNCSEGEGPVLTLDRGDESTGVNDVHTPSWQAQRIDRKFVLDPINYLVENLGMVCEMPLFIEESYLKPR